MSFIFRSTLRSTSNSSRSLLPSLTPMTIRYNSSSVSSSSSDTPKKPPTSGELFALPSSSSSSSPSSSSSSSSSRPNVQSAFSKLRFTPLDTLSSANDQDPETWWKTLSKKSIKGYPTIVSTGRTISVPRGGEFNSSYKRLNGLLRQSNLKKELRLNEFHEKGSVKKRRLLSERHRRRFKEMVRAKVQQVVSMRNRS